jgi:hypothetical protein
MWSHGDVRSASANGTSSSGIPTAACGMAGQVAKLSVEADESALELMQRTTLPSVSLDLPMFDEMVGF